MSVLTNAVLNITSTNIFLNVSNANRHVCSAKQPPTVKAAKTFLKYYTTGNALTNVPKAHIYQASHAYHAHHHAKYVHFYYKQTYPYVKNVLKTYT